MTSAGNISALTGKTFVSLPSSLSYVLDSGATSLFDFSSSSSAFFNSFTAFSIS
jgi:hypothetical protein